MSLDKIKISNLKINKNSDGDVLHAFKKTDEGFQKLQEIYFSKIKFSKIKAWKKHKKLSMNLIVPLGKVMFVFYSEKKKIFRKEIIGNNNYKRISVPPNIIFGFKGLYKPFSIVCNIADLIHDPEEIENILIKDISYKW